MTEQWDGRPQNPERDGWHWIIGWNRAPFVAQWVADTEQFVGGGIYEWRDGEDVAQGVVAQGWTYGGPCLTPDEVAARVAAARREAARLRRAWLRVIQAENGCPATGGGCLAKRCGCAAEMEILLNEGGAS